MKHLILVTDCGGSDQGRYNIAAKRCCHPENVSITFFATQSKNTLHTGFTAAAHGLSTVDHFGELGDGEDIGMLVNAAPRAGAELRGKNRKLEGEEIYALLLDNGVYVVGPNSGYNFFFLRDRIKKSWLITDTSDHETPFRSMEVMVPALAWLLDAFDAPLLQFKEKPLPETDTEEEIFVADVDDHGNLYLASTMSDDSWIPKMGKKITVEIGDVTSQLRHVNGIFAGESGEQTLTTGSLHLNGEKVLYIVDVGGSAHQNFNCPAPGTKVKIVS